jgi:predicted acyltransferase
MPRPARSKAADLLYFGALLFLVAWPLSSLMPINKRIWTSTFALLSGGGTLLAFALIYWLLDIRSAPRWTRPALECLRVFGTNAIAAVELSSVITATLDAVHLHIAGVTVSLHHAAHQYLFAPWLPPRIGSLAYALAIVALNGAFLYPLYRKRLYLRI